jgi:hypothetical protein
MTQIYANKRPSVNSTTWTRIFHSGNAEVHESDLYYDYYRVIMKDKSAPPKLFFGESAWMNCQRYVVDKIGMQGYNVFSK